MYTNCYCQILKIEERLTIQNIFFEQSVSFDDVTSIKIKVHQLTELGFRFNSNIFQRSSISGKPVFLAMTEKAFEIWIDKKEKIIVWRVDQLQNAYFDLTGEILPVNLIGGPV